MNAHLVYIALLVASVGYTVFQKYDSDKKIDYLERLKKTYEKVKSDLQNELQSLRSDHATCQQEANAAADKSQIEVDRIREQSKECDILKNTCVIEKENLSGEHQAASQEREAFAEQARQCDQVRNQCEVEKQTCLAQQQDQSQQFEVVRQQAEQCGQERNVCETDKQYWFGQQSEAKQQLENLAASCNTEVVQQQLNQCELEKQGCFQQLQNSESEKGQQIQLANLCVSERSRCEAEKQTCLQAMEASHAAPAQNP